MTPPNPDKAKDPSKLLDGVDVEPLFTSFDLAGLALKNRFVMAPMTRQFSPGGVPRDDVVAYYRRRAAHLGLIITEGTLIDHPSAGESDRVPRLYGDDPLHAWRKVVEAVHQEQGKIVAQLWHLGAARPPASGPHPDSASLSPSGLGLHEEPLGNAATPRDLNAVIESFSRAARDAQAVGFDGVEVHGAHGYLLDQFLWTVTNRRKDRYGGSLQNRARLSAEVVSAIRDVTGPEFPIVFRFSQWKATDFRARVVETPSELEVLLTPLLEAGVSAFHVSTRRYWHAGFDTSPRTLAGWTKVISGMPTIAVGSVGVSTPFGGSSQPESSLDLDPLLNLFKRGEFDLIALGRAVLSEPEWPTKVRANRLDEIRRHDSSHVSVLD